MRYAYATKTQMGIWKCADKPAADGLEERKSAYVELYIQNGQAWLYASKGPMVVKRDITAEDHTPDCTLAIIRSVIEQAEKCMGKDDIAYFENGQITIVSVFNAGTAEETEQTKAVMPYITQMELQLGDAWGFRSLRDFDKAGHATVMVKLESLLQVLSQYRKRNCWVYISVKDGENPLFITPQSDTPGELISGSVLNVDDGNNRIIEKHKKGAKVEVETQPLNLDEGKGSES